MFYIYHIKGVKIGCSTQPKKRVEKQGYSSYEILEEHSCIDRASQRELELQKEYGYKVDNTSYKQSYDWVTKGCVNGGKVQGNKPENIKRFKELQKKACILGGRALGEIQGKKNVESGHIQKLGKKLSEYNNRYQTCPHCGIITRGLGYTRWHGDKCKSKPNP